MSRKAGARVVLTVLASLAVGGAVGAGVGVGLFSPVVGVGLPVIIGITVGLHVKHVILEIRRMSSPDKGQAATSVSEGAAEQRDEADET